MIFLGEPNLFVKVTNRNKRDRTNNSFSFDSKGEYETENEELIERLKPVFKVKEITKKKVSK